MTGNTAQIFGEFLGTMILIVFGGGVCAAVTLNKSKAQGADWIVIAFGWAAGVTMAVYFSSFLGPAHINPAVTIAMALAGFLDAGLIIPFIIAQMLGAMAGATLVWLAYLLHFGETKDSAAILGIFSTIPAIRNYKANILTEVIGTFILILGLLTFSQNNFADGVNVFAVGGLILALGLSLGGPTGYAINPARDLGPRIAHALLPIKNKGRSDWGYAFVPVVGPIIGGVLAVLFYQIMV